ncbi:MAG: ABC transporter ATP-binding protein [Spirochaetes bacterium]|nr:ABC transporter ATP-binding protein [Spirochaetota bacterium]
MIRITGLEVNLPGFSLTDINLDIPENQFFALLGPTGSGKTVLLETIAGLQAISSGTIIINNLDITRLPPEKREIGIVYQNSCLFPHLNVSDNIRYGLRYRNTDKGKAGDRFDRLVDLLNIRHLLKRKPAHLSGGEVQRTALARALLPEPQILLLDEPFSAIDQSFRTELQQLLKKLQHSSNITFLMVTHSFSEALSLADCAAVMQNGKIKQSGSMMDIFKKPSSPFVANFVGMNNIYPAQFTGNFAEVNGIMIQMGYESHTDHGYIAIRPEDIVLSKSRIDSSIRNTFSGEIQSIIDRGYTFEIDVATEGILIRSLITRSALIDLGIKVGNTIFISFKAMAVHCFEA